ncbi:MAG: phosphoribosyltransferase family protein [Candidatus Caldarchaeum sp.]|nr:phosphoribosyltransferase family protein [Candidatus Caldarchaeum sp.]MDW8435949.1 phosphoribosyltransferase family protein [Candidatus Caldarchaeum sp.]
MVDWCWKLADGVRRSGWRPDVIVAVGRGGFVVSRMLSDLLQVDKVVPLLVKWYELKKKEGETYLAELVRAYAKAHETGCSAEEEIGRYVRDNLRVRIDFEQNVDLNGLKALLVEEISATGMHLQLAREVVKNRWKADEVKTAALVWKAPSVVGPDAFKVDYYVVKPAKFVWFQFPWSRFGDYVQFLKVMIAHESKKRNKEIWSEAEILETFRKWYGQKIDFKYFYGSLKILQENHEVKLEQALATTPANRI